MEINQRNKELVGEMIDKIKDALPDDLQPLGDVWAGIAAKMAIDETDAFLQLAHDKMGGGNAIQAIHDRISIEQLAAENAALAHHAREMAQGQAAIIHLIDQLVNYAITKGLTALIGAV